MFLRKPRKQDNSGKFHTTVEIDGFEHDVAVFWESSPPEPDVNWPGGLEITAVFHEDNGCLMDELSDEQITALESEAEGEPVDDDGYGDYLYDQEKDRRAEERDS